MALLAFAPPRRVEALLQATAADGAGRFLNAHEMTTLRALVGTLLPGPPLDRDPGGVEAGAPEAIDLLLAAFTFDPPLIHAGGPFSNRNGATHDDFADFVPLDRMAELAWRIRLEGSLGRKEREFAGPVRGLQQIYRDGLAYLDAHAGPTGFAALPAPAQIVILENQADATTQELVGVALANAIDAMYGPPEYGGNRNLVGWTTTNWRGDVQPRGYTDAEVSGPDPTAGGAAPASTATARATFDRFLPAAVGTHTPRALWWLA
ncbi:MAG: gluconate 2-dehydrogenase gamma chain [Actinomycetota bacterium]